MPISTKVVIVPGKFDSLHIGHRRLAQTAASHGLPTLVSFSGMSSALHWKPRLPVIADTERDRLLSAWSHSFGVPIHWKVIPFEQIRHMSPSDFLHLLVHNYSAAAVVCGPDWQFGKSRAGNVSVLRNLAPNYGLSVTVVQPENVNGVVSSTRIRNALHEGNVQLAAILLGRYHRAVGYITDVEEGFVKCDGFLNMLPAPSVYDVEIRVVGRATMLRVLVTVVRDEAQSFVRIPAADVFYCMRCEVHIDFVSRVNNTQ